MELKQKYEKALRSVTQLSMVQKRLFTENAESISKALEGISTLEKIKLETEGQLQDLPKSVQLTHARKLTRVYFLTDLTSQRTYFTTSILPIRDACQGDPLLAKEYERARVFVLSNAVEYFLETLQSGYDSIRRTKKFLELDGFLRSQETNEHVKGALAVVFERFLGEVKEKLPGEVPDFKRILDTYAEDLGHIFVDPTELREELFGYFLNQIRTELVEKLAFSFNNLAVGFLDRAEALYRFYGQVRGGYPGLAKQVEKCERQTFIKIKDFLGDYFDKHDVVLAIDEKYEFLSAVFKVYEAKALKMWVVDLIDGYIDSSHNKDSDLFTKYTLAFRLERATFKALDKFLRAYLKKKLESFLQERLALILKLDFLERKDKLPPTAEPAKLISYYKDYFRRFLDHVTKVCVPAVKASVIKDAEFRNAFYGQCIKAIVAAYHKELTAFLALELPGSDKKQVVELYANDLEEQLKEDFFGF